MNFYKIANWKRSLKLLQPLSDYLTQLVFATWKLGDTSFDCFVFHAESTFADHRKAWFTVVFTEGNPIIFVVNEYAEDANDGRVTVFKARFKTSMCLFPSSISEATFCRADWKKISLAFCFLHYKKWCAKSNREWRSIFALSIHRQVAPTFYHQTSPMTCSRCHENTGQMLPAMQTEEPWSGWRSLRLVPPLLVPRKCATHAGHLCPNNSHFQRIWTNEQQN